MASSKRAQLPPLQTTMVGYAGSLAAAASATDINSSSWENRSRSRSRAASPVLTPSTATTPFGEFGRDDEDHDERLSRSNSKKSRQDCFELQSSSSGGGINGRPASFCASSGLSASGSNSKKTDHHHHHVRSYSTSSNHRRGSSYTESSSSELNVSRPRSTNNSHSRPASRNNARSPLLYNHHQTTSPSSITHHTHHHYQGTISNSSSSSSLHSNHPSYRHHTSHIQALLQAPASFLRHLKLFLGIGTGEWRDCTTGCTKVPDRLRAYIPLLIWVGVSVGMALVIGIWHKEVFEGLDSLSVYLKSIGLLGHFVLFLCIFLTTFPPLPLYSTFIILSGYSFGLLQGFLISYTAALSGAVVVYLLSKVFLAQNMQGLLNKSKGLKKVVRAIEKRPKLLYLIRLSPYPYNVMNVLLASSSSLSFACYFWCTALALPKLVVHVSIGTTLHNFASSSSSHDNVEEEAREAEGRRTKSIAGAVGIALCLGVLVYLLYVARKAVDEYDDEEDEVDGQRLPSMESDENLSDGIGGRGRYNKLHTGDGEADLNSVYIHSPSRVGRKVSPSRDKREMSQINLSSTSDIFPHHHYSQQQPNYAYAPPPQSLAHPSLSVSVPVQRPSMDGVTPQTPIYHRKTFERQDTSTAFQTFSRDSKREKSPDVIEHLEHRTMEDRQDRSGRSAIVERLEDVAEHK